MATVIDPHTGHLQPTSLRSPSTTRSGSTPAPPRRGNRKGVVEAAVHFLTQRWWRTARLEDAAGAQASLDRFWPPPATPDPAQAATRSGN